MIEAGTGAVYNKAVKGVKVSKGALVSFRAYNKHSSRFLLFVIGIAFPTCISVNNCVAHFSPLA